MAWRINFGGWLIVGSALLLSAGGCQWYEHLQGPGFPGWDETGGNNFRAKDPDAKPSGFLYDRRSQQIEKNLGGNY